MSDQTFFVKIRGRTLGPFPPKRLSEMAQRGQLSRVHMLSRDGDHWEKASEFPELFKSAISAKVKQQPKRVNNPIATVEPVQAQQAQSPQQAQWHYGVNDETFGPVPKSTVVNLLMSGQLNETDMVWQDGMADWTTVQSIPEFAMVVEKQILAINTVSPGSKNDDSRFELLETTHSIRSQSAWVLFICIFMYLLAASLFFIFILGLVEGSQKQNPVLIAQAITALLQMGVIITAAIFLNRYVAASNRFVISQKLGDLNNAIRWLGRFWLFLSIVLIICLVVIISLIIYAYTVSGALFL